MNAQPDERLEELRTIARHAKTISGWVTFMGIVVFFQVAIALLRLFL